MQKFKSIIKKDHPQNHAEMHLKHSAQFGYYYVDGKGEKITDYYEFPENAYIEAVDVMRTA